MKKNIAILMKTPLFQYISENDLELLLPCLSAREKFCDKGEIVFMAGEKVFYVGVILSGLIHVIKEDVLGRRTILGEFGPGDLFGEAFSFGRVERLPVTVMAAAPSEIMLLDCKKIMGLCGSCCAHHTRLIGNMLAILAQKNILLSEKIEAMAQRTTREKLLTYLNTQAQKKGSLDFTIPFNRQELADYLGVDRSAMSSELGKLQAEGLIHFRRSSFQLHKTNQ